MKKFNCPHCKKEIDPKEIDIFQNYEKELKIEIKQKAEQENKDKLNAFRAYLKKFYFYNIGKKVKTNKIKES